MLSWLRRIMTSRSYSPTHRFAHLQLETLEDRCHPLEPIWSVALASPALAQFGNEALVGNFSYDENVNTYNPMTDAFAGPPILFNGQQFDEDCMWIPSLDNGVSSQASLKGPAELALSPNGDLIVANESQCPDEHESDSGSEPPIDERDGVPVGPTCSQ
jgi:hypothetical protein